MYTKLCKIAFLKGKEMKKARIHTREFKVDLCSQIDNGSLSKAQACRDHDLSPSLVDGWVTAFRRDGESAFKAVVPVHDRSQADRIAHLEQALGQAYLDIKILKGALEKKTQGKGL